MRLFFYIWNFIPGFSTEYLIDFKSGSNQMHNEYKFFMLNKKKFIVDQCYNFLENVSSVLI